jgi:hypothetical protein
VECERWDGSDEKLNGLGTLPVFPSRMRSGRWYPLHDKTSVSFGTV